MYVSSSVIGIMGSGILCRFMVLCIYRCNGFCCSIHSFYLFIVVNPTVVGVSTTSQIVNRLHYCRNYQIQGLNKAKRP